MNFENLVFGRKPGKRFTIISPDLILLPVKD